MSRFCGNAESKALLEAAEYWKENALLADGSIFTEKSLWQLKHLEALNQFFVNQPDAGKGTFFEKLSKQLEPTAPEVKQLAAEILWVMLLLLKSCQKLTIQVKPTRTNQSGKKLF